MTGLNALELDELDDVGIVRSQPLCFLIISPPRKIITLNLRSGCVVSQDAIGIQYPNVVHSQRFQFIERVLYFPSGWGFIEVLNLGHPPQCSQVPRQGLKIQLDPASRSSGQNELPLVELVEGGLFCGFERLIPQDQDNGHQQESYNDDNPWPFGAFLHLASPSPTCTRSGGKHQGVVAFVQRNQATGGGGVTLPLRWIHSLSSVVLPMLAGAEMSVRLQFTPAFNRSIKRGHGINPGRIRGI